MLVLCCGNPLHTQQRPLHGMKHEESMTKFVAYHRVSTQKQGRSGLGLEAQKASIVEYIRTVNGVLCGEFTEVETGKRKDRPELGAALAQCRLQGATLSVAKLDKRTRDSDSKGRRVESDRGHKSASITVGLEVPDSSLLIVAVAEGWFLR
jgi:Resolvase, N terminal domain